jgi:branched-chain amino acid transport system ATP-binding protein
VRSGIGYVPQEQAVFSGLTVKQNLLIGQMADATGESKIEEVVSLFPQLGQRFQQKAGTLSGGERKMLAIGRALLGRPYLLMLDEPAEGVWHGVIEEIAQRLERLAREIAVLIVEQHVELALRVAHYCYVMDRGRIALEGRSQDVRSDPQLVRLLAP